MKSELLFPGFKARRFATHGAEVFALLGGTGPPLVLLHGYPQTHVMWRSVVPLLRTRFSLVLPDLRGYGDSTGPAPDAEHVNYSKRAMGTDVIDVMDALGHKTFFVAGHDRRGRVAYRLALDHPDRVARLAVLDIVPTLDMWEQIDPQTAIAHWHWLLLAQPAPLPERLIGCDPGFFARHILEHWAGQPDALDPDTLAEYLRHFSKPSVIAAACEDYRAGATVDLVLDRVDRAAGRRVSCPTLVIWSKRFLHTTPSPRAIWEKWAENLTDVSIDCGHFIAEEAATMCAGALNAFFGSEQSG